MVMSDANPFICCYNISDIVLPVCPLTDLQVFRQCFKCHDLHFSGAFLKS